MSDKKTVVMSTLLIYQRFSKNEKLPKIAKQPDSPGIPKPLSSIEDPKALKIARKNVTKSLLKMKVIGG